MATVSTAPRPPAARDSILESVPCHINYFLRHWIVAQDHIANLCGCNVHNFMEILHNFTEI